MNYFIFQKEDSDFSELLKDKTLKPLLNFQIKFGRYLILGSYGEVDVSISSYITLKYGDMMVNKTDLFVDFSPKMHIDYSPDPNRPKKFKNL